MAFVKFALVADTHGDKINTECADAFLGFCEDFKPDIRIHGGDYMDCRPLRGKATAEEKAEGMQADFDAMEKFMRAYKPTVVLDGNHDHRLKTLAKYGSGIMRDWAVNGVEKLRQLWQELECQTLPYHIQKGVLRLGPLSIIHGYSVGENCLVKPMASKQCEDGIIMGHVHRSSYVQRFGKCGWTAPCCCDVDLEYNATNYSMLSQNNGWTSGEVNLSTGAYRVTPTIYRSINS